MPDNQSDLIRIREAIAADIGELARLRWDFRCEEQAGHARAEFLRDCEAWLHAALASGRWIIAVAETEPDRLIGCMFMQRIEKVPVPGEPQRAWGYVTNAYVEADQRGRNVGRQLLDLLIEAAKTHGYEFLIVWPSAEAVTFYRKAGFRFVSETHVGADDQPPMALPFGAEEALNDDD